jgi:hypothetical protein
MDTETKLAHSSAYAVAQPRCARKTYPAIISWAGRLLCLRAPAGIQRAEVGGGRQEQGRTRWGSAGGV